MCMVGAIGIRAKGSGDEGCRGDGVGEGECDGEREGESSIGVENGVSLGLCTTI